MHHPILMTAKSKNRLTITILLMAIIQGPLFYYFTEGFVKLILLLPFALNTLVLTIILLMGVINYRSTNKVYHIWGLMLAAFLGISTFFSMEWIDFNLFLSKRNTIVEQIKSGQRHLR